MILPKKLISIALFILALNTLNLHGQGNDLQAEVHNDLEHYVVINPKGDAWENSKKTFANYNQDQVVRAIIAELEDDRGSELANKERNVAATKLFKLLNLPHTLVCDELNKQIPPQSKASLIFMLWGDKSPEVTQALLRQINDRRLGAQEPAPMEIGNPHSFRVCDVAFNTLVHNSNVEHVRKVYMTQSDAVRDEVIQEVLKELHLSVPES